MKWVIVDKKTPGKRLGYFSFTAWEAS